MSPEKQLIQVSSLQSPVSTSLGRGRWYRLENKEVSQMLLQEFKENLTRLISHNLLIGFVVHVTVDTEKTVFVEEVMQVEK